MLKHINKGLHVTACKISAVRALGVLISGMLLLPIIRIFLLGQLYDDIFIRNYAAG